MGAQATQNMRPFIHLCSGMFLAGVHSLQRTACDSGVQVTVSDGCYSNRVFMS